MDNLETLPVIDLALGARLVGNKKDIALEMLGMLVERLPQEVALIKQDYNAQNATALLQHVHKLHGALCYCGVPRLKSLVARLESDLKSNIMDSLLSLLNQLDIEVDLLLEHYSRLLVPLRS